MTYANWTAATDLDNRLDAFRYDPVLLNAKHRVEVGNYVLDDLESLTTAPINYGILQPREFLSAGIPMVRAVDLQDPFIDSEVVVLVPPDIEAPYHRSRLRRGDILLSIAGTLGRVGIVPTGWKVANVNQSVARIRSGERLDGYFLAAFFLSPTGGLAVERESVGSVQRHLNIEDIRTLRVPLPEPRIQQAIGNQLRKAERLRGLASFERNQAAKHLARLMSPGLPNHTFRQHGWHLAVDPARLDAWFHRPEAVWRCRQLDQHSEFVPLHSVCELVEATAKLSAWQSATFDYFEIGGIDATTGEATSTTVPVSEAPSRAKYLVQAGDLLVSTVRPNLRKVGQVDPDRKGAGVATSGFSVWRASSPEIGAYLRACLAHDVGVEQLMRWNSGATYPAVDRDVPGLVLVPFQEDTAMEIGGALLGTLRRIRESAQLVDTARDAVESLIDSTLDVDSLMATGEAAKQWLTDNPSPPALESDHA